ncbi:hypothetical protein Agub_g5930 [Astrephomene gubernaculifera]|uniref:Uncharacterized protein n=1 Tax=Astrephomene gubernaculifera TaxID=47775 RepID=A0AAD3DRL4_9CHLO|nr:hypothetical protein Agub_g5930 [Astrephomene gubernaculifera]
MAASEGNQSTPIKPGSRQGITNKVGRNAAELAKPCFPAGTSRVSRSRATRALGLRKRKPVSPQSPPSPNQESAVNSRTGKVAFGPWLGPFEASTSAMGPSDPLFADPNGNTYNSLSAVQMDPPAASDDTTAAPHDKQPQSAPSKQQQAKAAAAKVAGSATAATQQLVVMMNKMVQRAAAAAAAHTRQPAQWLGRSKAHGSGRCNTTMARAINQPRKS